MTVPETALAKFKEVVRSGEDHPIWHADTWTSRQIAALMAEDEQHPEEAECIARVKRLRAARTLAAKRRVLQDDLDKQREWFTFMRRIYASQVPYEELPDFHRRAVDEWADMMGPYPVHASERGGFISQPVIDETFRAIWQHTRLVQLTKGGQHDD